MLSARSKACNLGHMFNPLDEDRTGVRGITPYLQTRHSVSEHHSQNSEGQGKVPWSNQDCLMDWAREGLRRAVAR